MGSRARRWSQTHRTACGRRRTQPPSRRSPQEAPPRQRRCLTCARAEHLHGDLLDVRVLLLVLLPEDVHEDEEGTQGRLGLLGSFSALLFFTASLESPVREPTFVTMLKKVDLPTLGNPTCMKLQYKLHISSYSSIVNVNSKLLC